MDLCYYGANCQSEDNQLAESVLQLAGDWEVLAKNETRLANNENKTNQLAREPLVAAKLRQWEHSIWP